MKTKLHTAALITLITLITTNLFASEFNFNEESYINDIPSKEFEKWLKLESERFENIVLTEGQEIIKTAVFDQ